MSACPIFLRLPQSPQSSPMNYLRQIDNRSGVFSDTQTTVTTQQTRPPQTQYTGCHNWTALSEVCTLWVLSVLQTHRCCSFWLWIISTIRIIRPFPLTLLVFPHPAACSRDSLHLQCTTTPCLDPLTELTLDPLHWLSDATSNEKSKLHWRTVLSSLINILNH